VTTTILYVCVTCRGTAAGAPDVPVAERPGARLFAAVGQRLAAADGGDGDGDRGIAVVPANCLSNCQRGCSAAVSASGKWTYVIGDLDPDQHAGDVVDFARLHRAHEEGVPEWRARPEHVRKHTIARVPPVKPAAPSSAAPSQEKS
jgi:predicted metal-binding protein